MPAKAGSGSVAAWEASTAPIDTDGDGFAFAPLLPLLAEGEPWDADWRLSPRDVADSYTLGGWRTKRDISAYLASQREADVEALQEWLWPRPADLPRYHDVNDGFAPGDPGWRNLPAK